MFPRSITGRTGVNARLPQVRSPKDRPLQRERSRAVSAPSLNYLSRHSCAKADQRSTKNSRHCCAAFTLEKQRERTRAPRPAVALREGGFTLLELLIVVGIIALLLVLMAPAFTTIKSGTDVTSAAYTIKGVLDTARTYAKANNTYTWVGFAGSIADNITGQVQLVVVASKDGTDLGTSVNQPVNRVDITAGVTPVGKVMRLENAHIGDTGNPTGSGTDFESRAAVNINYRVGAAGSTYNSDYYFIEQGIQFDRWIRFSPRGEAVVKGGATQITQYAEVGLLPTHGTALAAGINPASGNLVAIQISGFGSNVRIYRR
jgi:prepilin-type N-terminal cleavage/methylation domain-containing protein